MAVTEAIENYLEAILILSYEKDGVHAIDLAVHMGFSRPTVSIMLGHMKEQGLVIVDDEKHIKLTESGREVAQRIYERHQLISGLLMRLGVSEKTAKEDACRIEHDLSPETFEAIKKYSAAHEIERLSAE